MKTTKSSSSEFIKNKLLYYNRDCYRMIEKKEHIATFFILKHLNPSKSMTKGQLCKVVKADFNAYIDSLIEWHKRQGEGYVNRIRSDKDSRWYFRRDPKTKKIKRSYLSSRHAGRIIDLLTPLFLNLKTQGVKNPGQAHVISLNRRGKKLWKEWQRIIAIKNSNKKVKTSGR